ncbi:MAG: MarR family transcriptional regulator [Clostridia bacterium]|nr:MarR family transcriptional regulator [Clostridia bacterium]
MATLMRKINILSRAEGVYRSNKLKGTPLSPCHHSYVLAISGNPGMSQDELARHLCVNKSGVTRHLSFLEQHGYVKRITGENDKRISNVYPTEKMLEILPAVKEIVLGWDAYLSSALSEDERETLHLLLDKITVKADNYVTVKGDDNS